MLNNLSKILGYKEEKSSQEDADLKQRLLPSKDAWPRYNHTGITLSRAIKLVDDFSMVLANYSLRGGSWQTVLAAKKIMDEELQAPDYKNQVEEKRENKLRMS